MWIRLKGFSYGSNAYWAKQSMQLLSKDLQDYNMVEKLGLQWIRKNYEEFKDRIQLLETYKYLTNGSMWIQTQN